MLTINASPSLQEIGGNSRYMVTPIVIGRRPNRAPQKQRKPAFFAIEYSVQLVKISICSSFTNLSFAQFCTALTMAKNTDRKRTFTGCITCRQRRAKCDERRPACSSCERRGIKCEGYAPKLVWVTDDREYSEERQSRRGAVYRYPLFSGKFEDILKISLLNVP